MASVVSIVTPAAHAVLDIASSCDPDEQWSKPSRSSRAAAPMATIAVRPRIDIFKPSGFGQSRDISKEMRGM
jgi:hypothetical protein